jgi:hypothetical protein
VAYKKRRTTRREALAVDDGRYVAFRYRWLRSLLAASEPGSPAAILNARIRERRNRLDATDAPVEEKLAQLEAYIASLGLADAADQFIRSLVNGRTRRAPPDDWSHRITGRQR